MVSKDSITLGLSSASIAATESQFSMSSSSSRSLSLIVPSPPLLAVGAFGGRLERSGGRNGRCRHRWQPLGLARDGDARDQLAVGTDHRRRPGLGVRAGIGCVEVDDVAKKDLALVELVPPDDDGLEGERALAEPRDHGLAAGLDALGDGDLALARKEFLRAHFAQIHAHGVVSALGGFLGRGLGRNRPLLDFD